MGPEFKSLMIMIIVLSPFIIPMFLILVSFSKKNLQGIVYLALLSITQAIGYMLRPMFGSVGIRPDIVKLKNGQNFILSHRACNIIEDPWFSQYSMPSFHAVFHSFTIVYIFTSKIKTLVSQDIGLLIAFFILFMGDAAFRVMNGCVTMIQYLFGVFFGAIFGFLFYLMVNSINPNLLYGNVIGEMDKCKLERARGSCKHKVVEIDEEGKVKDGTLMDVPPEWTNDQITTAMGNTYRNKPLPHPNETVAKTLFEKNLDHKHAALTGAAEAIPQ